MYMRGSISYMYVLLVMWMKYEMVSVSVSVSVWNSYLVVAVVVGREG